MIDVKMYKSYLTSNGSNLGEVKRNQSDRNLNISFTRTPEYKRVYILTKDGWKWEDAKYFRHQKESISSDAMDYYIQFRPKVHYPIGSYIIIPDDMSPDINLTELELQNPFLQPVKNRVQWWIIVGRSVDTYVKYEVLNCNYDFKWIINGEVQHSFACVRNSNSYTSGVWSGDRTVTLDELNGAWLPDTYYTYGDKLSELGLYDCRTIAHEQRLMVTNNDINPKVYMVTKVNDLTPKGIIKLSFKQDEFDEKRDNIEMKICDYYTDQGGIKVAPDTTPEVDNTKSSYLVRMIVNSDNELEVDHAVFTDIESIKLGTTSYFNIVLNTNEQVNLQWRVELVDKENVYTDKDKEYYKNLIKLVEYDDITIAIRPSKALSLKDKHFLLTVSDENGDYYSSVEMEVQS